MSKKVFIVMSEGFEEIELITPADVLRRLGVNLTLAGVGGDPVRGAHGLYLRADMPLEAVNPDEYDAVIVPGGPAAWELSKNPHVLQLLRDMRSAHPRKLIAAICAAPMVLAAAGVLESGQKVTCYPAPDVMKAVDAVATLQQDAVVREAYLVTGMGPACALDFSYAVGVELAGEQKVMQLRRDMCAPNLPQLGAC